MISSKDRNEILDLVTRYSFAWDSSDADEFAAIFTDTAIM
ncbi:MAG: SnoaL-like domain-containing protein, partial [Gammaproteobacteria bacterium]|nr:SnoaL-like domain-containing protein [Gammaproteobacteria bacterium]